MSKPAKAIPFVLATALGWNEVQPGHSSAHIHHEAEEGPPLNGRIATPSANIPITSAPFDFKGPVIIERSTGE